MADESVHELTAAYALDALDEHELERYEAHLAGCERCREELASLSEAAAALAYAIDAPPPPADLRERIVEAAAGDRSQVVPLARRRAFLAVAGLAAAAACAAIGLGIWAATLHHSLGAARHESASRAEVLDVLSNSSSRRFPLAGTGGWLYVDPARRGALLVDDLPAAPTGRTYEAWVLGGGAPQPAGIFGGGGRTAFALRRPVPGGALVGVTLEPGGGSAAPTTPVLFRART